MRHYITILLTLLVILGSGCSLVTAPAYAYAGDAQDTWPAFFGTANGGADNGYVVFWDQNAAAYQAPRLIANDLLALQWTPQRQGIGWDTKGTWDVSFIENTTNNLQIFESPDDDWQDDAGAWAMLDDDNSEDWLALDAETRQDYVWIDAIVITTPRTFFIDLAAGVPALTLLGIVPAADTTDQFSICLDQMLIGAIHFIGIDNSDAFAKYFNITPAVYVGALDWENTVAGGGETFPQIISGGYNELYAFYTAGNLLSMVPNKIGGPPGTAWNVLEDVESVYVPTGTLTQDYHATWLTFDDTIHVVLVDFIPEGAPTLRYMRRIPNGWTATVTLLTVDSTILGDAETLNWPTITVDTLGNIMIYYILGDITGGGFGDLQSFYLDADLYSGWAVPGNWVRTLNVDGAGDPVKWVVAPDSIVIASDM